MTTATLQPTTYETVIGLEVHVQLKTDTKLFCACSTRFGAAPNQHTCPICLGLPGVLPVLNEKAVEYAIRLGLALGCRIAPESVFSRKQYFYPDLPKGYQISQYDKPLCEWGNLTLKNGRQVRITRAHLEEDAGKLVHSGAAGLAGSTHSLVDLNRAGTPLLEVVSEPDIRSAEEARDYVTQLRSLVRYLGVCDGNLEEGSMRCDANVSLRPVGQSAYGTKAEIKNMNSFKAIQRAIESEVVRQTDLLNRGESIVQETRLWHEAEGVTAPMRSKEEAHDYRYFPEPDLRPLQVSADWIQTIQASQPELPSERLARFQTRYGLSDYDASVLVEFKELGDFFDQAAQQVIASSPSLSQEEGLSRYKTLANLVMGDITAYLKAEKKALEDTRLTPETLAELAGLVCEGTIGSAVVKKLLPTLLAEGGSPKSLVESQGLAQVSDEGALRGIIQTVIDQNPDNVAQYRSGKDKLFGFFVGQVMKVTQGSANPAVVNTLLKEMLDNDS